MTCRRRLLSLLTGLAFVVNWGSDSAAEVDTKRPSTVLHVAGIVLKWIRADKEANYGRIEPLIREAARHGAQLVVTTECFLDGYSAEDRAISEEDYRALGEPIPGGPYFQRLAGLARELKIYLVAGILEANGKDRFNTAVLIGPDGTLLGKYHKQRMDEERARNTPGKVSTVHDTPFGKMGILICADRRYPDVVRRFRENGAEFLICPSGGMFGSKKNDPIVQSRSKENNIPIVFVHPAEFLVTNADGSIEARTLVGDRLVIGKQQAGGPSDLNRIFYYDLPIRPGVLRQSDSGQTTRVPQTESSNRRTSR
jgi:predicted amidohydrolase